MNQHQTQLFEIDGVKVPVETNEDEQNISNKGNNLCNLRTTYFAFCRKQHVSLKRMVLQIKNIQTATLNPYNRYKWSYGAPTNGLVRG